MQRLGIGFLNPSWDSGFELIGPTLKACQIIKQASVKSQGLQQVGHEIQGLRASGTRDPQQTTKNPWFMWVIFHSLKQTAENLEIDKYPVYTERGKKTMKWKFPKIVEMFINPQ